MKRRWILLPLLLMLLLAACGQQQNAETETTDPPTVETTAAKEPPVSTTLMVYMIGSDLEAKAAAGTSDLEEIAASGVDLTNTNVLVYAGGTPYWHNELVAESSNAVLQLTPDGFRAVQTLPAVSMGEPETLTSFLEFGYKNFATERHALILWNHGSGPVRGYGQDLAFEGGSLLLTEMEQALAASPFGPENKLAFVGFDACLMASAELACIWDDYAEYMVSSQEVEPSIGWNYRFVKDVSGADLPAVLTAMTEDYLASCRAYYAERGYDERETTLSCVDLSKAAELETAINALFDRANDDVSLKYDQLSALRVNTRAFGRASTGAEYDLVDLGDAAAQLQTLYSEEASRLQQILSEMVISNSTNTQTCSGLSLYYPFYNKDYYFKSVRGAESWQTTYQNLGLFPAYQQYLEGYQQIWNGTDRKDTAATSITPTEQDGAYCLQLTQAQQDCYASCKYYILQRESAEMYKCLFVSSNVTNNEGLLTANFDGNAIYVKDKYGRTKLPVVEEKDQIGNLSHYSIYVHLSNQIPGTDLLNAKYLGAEKLHESYRYHLTLDNATKELSVCALLPHDEQAQDLTGGKLEDVDTSQWGSVLFWDQTHRYLTRDENGLILPLSQWRDNSWFTGMELYFVDDIEFTYEPLDGGEYYLMMEVLDTQGSRYCSELLPVQVPDREVTPYRIPETTVQWESGDRVLLKEQNGIAVYMNLVEDLGQTYFTLELENNNDFGANLQADELVCNGNIYCKSYYGSIHARPGQSAWFNTLSNLGFAEECGDLEELTSIGCQIYVRDEKNGAMIMEPEYFHIQLPEEVTEAFRNGYDRKTFTQTAYMGARAEKQVIYEDQDMKITLMGLGSDEDEYTPTLYGIVQVENRTNEAMTVGFDGAAINNILTYNSVETVTIPGGCSTYMKVEIIQSRLEKSGISQIGSVALLMRVIRGAYIFTGFSEPIWCPVTLTERAESPEAFREEEFVIYDQNGIRVALGQAAPSSSSTRWKVSVYNGTQNSIKVDCVDVKLNGQPDIWTYISEAKAGPGQYGIGELYCNNALAEVQSLSFRILVTDIYEERILFDGAEEFVMAFGEKEAG